MEQTAKVRRIWTEVLGRPVDDTADFFESGGDSLAAVELVARLEAEVGCEIGLDLLFVEGTLGALLDYVAAEGSSR